MENLATFGQNLAKIKLKYGFKRTLLIFSGKYFKFSENIFNSSLLDVIIASQVERAGHTVVRFCNILPGQLYVNIFLAFSQGVIVDNVNKEHIKIR